MLLVAIASRGVGLTYNLSIHPDESEFYTASESLARHILDPEVPFEEEKVICTICERSCAFIKRTVNGVTVKMIPEKISQSCSLGVFGLPVVENLTGDESKDYIDFICARLCGATDNYKGEALQGITPENLFKRIKNAD